MRASRRRGFTLVELLVVIAIIGVLIALLLPAVQAARAAARRTQCTNNLKQIGLGVQHYHDKYKVLPAGNITPGNCCGTLSYTNWAIAILPYLELQTLYDRYEMRLVNEDQPILPDGFCVVQQVIPVYRCPDDDTSDLLQRPASGPRVNKDYRHGSYRGITGIGANAGYFDNDQWSGRIPESYRGPLHTVGSRNLIHEGLGSVRDGTSSTLLVGEYMTRTTTNRGTFWGYSYTCYSLASVGFEARRYIADYNTCKAIAGDDGENACKRGLGSFHTGGLHFLKCDGSVSFFSTTMDVSILAAMGTMDGQEAIATGQ